MFSKVTEEAKKFESLGQTPVSVALAIVGVVFIIIAITPGHFWLKTIALAYAVFP